MVKLCCQIGILVFGSLQIFLLSLKHHHVNKWGWIAGIIGQPFFIVAYIKARQWGLVLLWCFYTYAILQGIWNHWIRPAK